MRKNLLLPSLAAIALLTLGSGLALACGGAKTTSTASAAGSACASKADVSTASYPSGCSAACAEACAGAKTASAAGHCGGAAMSSAGADHCNGAAMKTAGAACAAKGDFFVSNYVALTAAMNKHCSMSTSAAAYAWHAGVEKLLVNAGDATKRENLNTLAGYLADWPSDASAADARYRAISEWTAGYCQLNPEQTSGAKVVTCPVSGRRWVEMETAATGDSQS